MASGLNGLGYNNSGHSHKSSSGPPKFHSSQHHVEVLYSTAKVSLDSLFFAAFRCAIMLSTGVINYVSLIL